MDEAELSAVTGNPVARSLLKTCALSGKRAEPEHFGTCGFTGAEVLNTELGVSDVSGKRYRLDQQLRSVVSGKTGHKEEFLFCHETRQPIMPEEAEQCELTKFAQRRAGEMPADRQGGLTFRARALRRQRQTSPQEHAGEQ